MAALDRLLGLADEVVRHKVVRLPDAGGPAAAAAGRPHRPPAERGRERSRDGDRQQRDPGRQRHPGPRAALHQHRPATATFGLAVNRRWQNRQTQEWEEATSFFDVVCWREMAENVSESLTRGPRVVVTGRLEQRSWETPDGDKRSKVEVVADEVGPSLRWATAQITKNERRGPGDGPRAAGARQPAPPPRHSGGRRRRRLRIRRGALLMARNN